jgi:mutator protein MutT
MEQYHRMGKDGRKYWGKRGAGIIYTDGKRVLLLKRASKGDNKGKWSIPGGKVEQGESAMDAAQRESKEEIGFFGGTMFGDYEDRDGKHLYTTYFYEVDKPFQAILSDEHDDYQWVEIEDVDEKNLHHRLESNWPHFKKTIKRRFTMNTSFENYLHSVRFF